MNNKLELIDSRHTSERCKKSQTANFHKSTTKKLRVKNASSKIKAIGFNQTLTSICWTNVHNSKKVKVPKVSSYKWIGIGGFSSQLKSERMLLWLKMFNLLIGFKGAEDTLFKDFQCSLTSKRVCVSLGMCSWNCQSRADRFHLEYLTFIIINLNFSRWVIYWVDQSFDTSVALRLAILFCIVYP